ncbi:MAG: hypothetical protein GX458_14220 [Phyllobacteriaceae bacterium]|nr:hypothetical protein [Phyllobacteriaceae bacterium]
MALLFALAAAVSAAAVGVTLNFTHTVQSRKAIQDAADAAALAAVHTAQNHLATNGWSAANAEIARTAGDAAAMKTFAANTATLQFVSTPTEHSTTTIVDALNISSHFDVTADLATIFAQLLGIGSVKIAATSEATLAMPLKYYQFVFLVDVSGSMAVGATSSDITKLTATYDAAFTDNPWCVQAPSSYTSCAFACHDPSNAYPCTQYPDKKTRRTKAASLGIKLKIDYAKSAVATFLGGVQSAIGTGNAVASIYTYATDNYTIDQNVSLSQAQIDAESIEIEPIIPSLNWGYTNTTTALNTLATTLKNVGDGSSATSRKTFVVFITDGIEDNLGFTCYNGRCTGVSYGTGCTKVKNTGATLVSIEATYPVIPGDAQYQTLVAPYATSLQATMKSCATSANWYFSANDGPAITNAMNGALQQVVRGMRLSK